MSYTWEYRVTKKKIQGLDTCEYVVREVYFKDGEVNGWTEGEGFPWGEDMDELRADLVHFLAAFDKPVIDLDDEEQKKGNHFETARWEGEGGR